MQLPMPLRTRRNEVPRRVWMLTGAALGATAAALLGRFDKRRRHMTRDRAAAKVRRGARAAGRRTQYTMGVAEGVKHKLTTRRNGDREYDDVTLARKVETEVFRPADAPKGTVDVNVCDGIVELRGMVERPEQIRELGAAVEKVRGVAGVHNLLHTPGTEPGHSPVSDPDAVRARAAKAKAG